MTQTQLNLPFEIVITKDGSPSLAFFKDGFSQMMHSSQGAFSETEFVYGKALDIAFKEFSKVNVLSVGLGFGYMELSTVVRAGNAPTTILSYEIEPSLRQAWLDFINNRPGLFTSSYEQIFSSYSKKFGVSAGHLKQFFLNESFSLREALDIATPPLEKFNCILFDPFCSKFSPEFWNEDTLTHFLQTVTEDACVFATYAAKGSLTRSLKAAGFQKLKNKGFAGKREFTLAVKNLIP